LTYDFSELPEDAEEAFLVLEARYRHECETALNDAREHEVVGIYYTDYIAQVLGAAEELGLVEAAFGTTEIPSIETVDFQTYQNFSKRVKHFRTRLEIRHGRRAQGYSVQFDTTTRAKLHHLLRQIRSIFEKIEVGESKREALVARLADLEIEVDRRRTRFEAYAALAIEVADVAGEVVERSKILDVLDAVARLFGVAKKEEAQRRLPPPSKPKQIEHHKGSVDTSTMDDDIPF
jgi:hypothetical protein